MKKLICALMALVILTGMAVYTAAEAMEMTEGYVLCSPGGYVNIRSGPSRKSECLGMFETGDKVTLDGKKKNGFLHCVNLALEDEEGWIHSGYVVSDEPEYIGGEATIVSRGRLAARMYVNGKRTRWLKSGASLVVWYWSEEWALTNCGYVKSMYLELDGV